MDPLANGVKHPLGWPPDLVKSTIFDDSGRLDLEGQKRSVDLRSDSLGRRPLQPLHPATHRGLIEIAARLDPLVLKWGC